MLQAMSQLFSVQAKSPPDQFLSQLPPRSPATRGPEEFKSPTELLFILYTILQTYSIFSQFLALYINKKVVYAQYNLINILDPR